MSNINSRLMVTLTYIHPMHLHILRVGLLSKYPWQWHQCHGGDKKKEIAHRVGFGLTLIAILGLVC